MREVNNMPLSKNKKMLQVSIPIEEYELLEKFEKAIRFKNPKITKSVIVARAIYDFLANTIDDYYKGKEEE